MFKKLCSIAIELLVVGVGARVLATTVVIDANQFAVGDGLAQVNSIAQPLGIVLNGIHANSFQVGLDASGDKAFQVLPEAARADLVANFTRAVDFVRVTFGSIGYTRASYLALFDRPLFPAGPFEGFLDSRIHVGSGDVALDYQWSSPGTPSQVRAALMEQDIAQPNSVYVRAIEVRFVQADLPGDMDLDRAVDRTDAALFVAHLGAEPGSIWTSGDFNADGATTLLDMRLLQENLGMVAPSAAASQLVGGDAAGANHAVPEPGSFTLAFFALAGLTLLPRSRAR